MYCHEFRMLLHGVLYVVIFEAKHLPSSLLAAAQGCLRRYVCCNAGPDLVGKGPRFLDSDPLALLRPATMAAIGPRQCQAHALDLGLFGSQSQRPPQHSPRTAV